MFHYTYFINRFGLILLFKRKKNPLNILYYYTVIIDFILLIILQIFIIK